MVTCSDTAWPAVTDLGDRVITWTRVTPSDEQASEVTWLVGRRPGPCWTINSNLPWMYDVCRA